MGERTPNIPDSQPPSRLPSRVETLLCGMASGDRDAGAELLPLVYEELRRLAAARLAALPPGQTLQPTALVHEAFVRLVGGAAGDPGWKGRSHFFGAAANAMRNVLVDLARSKSRGKRGGGRGREALSEIAVGSGKQPVDVLALDEALRKLEREDALKAQIVGLRFFAGLSVDETAAALGVAAATVDRHWAYARAWLRRELSNTGSSGAAANPGADDD